MTEQHVALADLFALATGGPLAGDRAAAERHIAGCAECAATLARFSTAAETVRLDASAAPSAAALDRIRNLMPAPERAPFAPFAGLRRALAALTFDARRPQALAGLRGVADAYLLTYAVDDVTLDLEIEPPDAAATGWHLTGQLDASGATFPADIAVVGGRATQQIATTDEHGVFALTLEPGDYDFLVNLDTRVVVVQGVDVG